MKINHAILHVFDFVSCENTFAREEMDLTDKTSMRYIGRQATKGLNDIDNKRGSFAPDSHFAQELRDYFAGSKDFVALSQEIGRYLADELEHMTKSISTDVLVVDFEEEPEKNLNEMSEEEIDAKFRGVMPRYFGIFLLESKQAYMHELFMGDTGERNDIARHHAVLPNPSQKIQSYAVVDLRTLDVRFQDKLRTIAGQEKYLIPEGLLQCSMEASSKEAFTAVTEIVEAVAEEYGANVAVALSKAKAYAIETVDEEEEIVLEDLAEAVFEDNAEMKQRFEENAATYELPERMPMERRAVERVAKKHKILTDTGIEITFPAEYSESPEYLTFTNEADGSISISLKNISHIENK